MNLFSSLCVTLFLSLNLDAANLHVRVASKNMDKIQAVKEAFSMKFPDDEIYVEGIFSSSDIPAQPIGFASALKGLENRLKNLNLLKLAEADYLVSIENYIEKKDDGWVDIGAIMIRDNRQQRTLRGLSKETPIPTSYVDIAFTLSQEKASDGIDVTVGKAIQEELGPCIDDKNWHRHPFFGSTDRKDLLREALFKTLNSEELAFIKSKIALYPDFPKKGILFEDFFPILNDPDAFHLAIELLYHYYKDKQIEKVVGLESRGFIIGSALAYRLGCGFVPVRKPGKLPGNTFQITYKKEYGEDTLVIAQNALKPHEKVLVIDDLIATGGSAKAAIELIKLAGAEPLEFVSLLEIKQLHGRDKLGIPTFNLLDQE